MNALGRPPLQTVFAGEKVVVTDHVAPIRRADEDLPARVGGRLKGGVGVV